MTVFYDFPSCSLVDSGRRFGGAYCLYHEGALMRKHPWKFGQFSPDCTVKYLIRQKWPRIALLQLMSDVFDAVACIIPFE